MIIQDSTDLTEAVSDEISPYNASYPMMLLSRGLSAKLAQADTVVRTIYRAVAKEAPTIAQVEQSFKKGYRYVVNATEDTLQAIDSGKIKLTTEKSGRVYAQIREANGRYGTKLPIKKENFRRGIDPVQMANAIQIKALQEQIQTIEDQISIIDHGVRDVLLGQQNDRLGLYYSGLALFLESRNVSDKEMKTALIAQSLRGLSEATFQLTLTMQSDIDYLVRGEYKTAKGKRVELIEKRMESTHKSFSFIHQATMLRAGIYCEQNEMAAMSTVLSEYSQFIEGTIAKNAAMLSQCDVSDSGTDEGVWKSRAKYRLDVSDFTKQIKSPDKVIYLGISQEVE